MSTAMQIILGFGLAAVIGLILAVYWLSKSREKMLKAEAIAHALVKGKEKESAAKKIMEEPVADESAWIERTRERLRSQHGGES